MIKNERNKDGARYFRQLILEKVSLPQIRIEDTTKHFDKWKFISFHVASQTHTNKKHTQTATNTHTTHAYLRTKLSLCQYYLQ